MIFSCPQISKVIFFSLSVCQIITLLFSPSFSFQHSYQLFVITYITILISDRTSWTGRQNITGHWPTILISIPRAVKDGHVWFLFLISPLVFLTIFWALKVHWVPVLFLKYIYLSAKWMNSCKTTYESNLRSCFSSFSSLSIISSRSVLATSHRSLYRLLRTRSSSRRVDSRNLQNSLYAIGPSS